MVTKKKFMIIYAFVWASFWGSIYGQIRSDFVLVPGGKNQVLLSMEIAIFT